MKKAKDHKVDLSTPEYDFSRDNPFHQEMLRKLFLKSAAEAVFEISDEDLDQVYAAGTFDPTVKSDKEDLL